MRARVSGLVVVVALLGVATAVNGRQALKATATIKGDGISGQATFREVPAQLDGGHDMKFMTGATAVEVTVTVTGLKPGAHGFHLHAVGTCEAPGFTSAGGHFDPGPGGNGDPDANHPYHMGDLPNLVADAGGKATLKAITTRVTLGPGPLSLFDTDGTAVIVHGNPDSGETAASKAGLSGGPRVACGVVTK